MTTLHSESDLNALDDQSPTLYSLRDMIVRFRLPILIIGHTLIFAFAYWIAFLMRFTLHIPARYMDIYWQGLPVVVAVKLVIFYSLGSFHGWWRHVNFSDFISLVKSATVASLAIIAADYFIFQLWLAQIPRTVVINDLAITIVVVGALRSVWRLWDERIAPLENHKSKERALLVGNHYHAARIAHLINAQRSIGVRIVGLISTVGESRRRYSDLRVVGQFDEVQDLVKAHRARTLFVMSGALQGKELRSLLESASEENLIVKILPPLSDQLMGSDKVPIRDVSYNDLLRRNPIELDTERIGILIEGRTILVTGAGGSIGSELCRQLVRFNPAKIVLLGRGENRIFHIERELNGIAANVHFVPKIVNIVDSNRMREVFEEFHPNIVFHAAAHKHVSLVERNVGESIINNILGTKIVADLADEFCVERFMMVSTDKAVHPTSIMGCTKQMAERYCQALDCQSKTMFISTRFGNVLGSAGSVVPIFQEQIRRGGPITLTDKRMTRYFMTIPEASQLVIQAASMGKGGEIFILDMGEPVRILDLANDLIRLAGHSPEAIEIVETGARPGEKLFEELYYDNEQSLPTYHEKIHSSYCRMFDLVEVEAQIERLVESAFDNSDKIRQIMKQAIPEYSYISRQYGQVPVNGDEILRTNQPESTLKFKQDD